jgi:hypothetical protein
MALTKAHNRMISGSYINVKDFGAVGDGVTDDSAAIQAAFDQAAADEINAVYTGSSNAVNGGPVVYFPVGIYRMNTKLDVGTTRHVSMLGSGKVLILGDTSLTRGVDFISGTGLRYLTVLNIQFQNFDTVFDISTGNLDLSRWDFENVQAEAVNLFIDTNSHSTSRSTIVSFRDCIWQYGVDKIARIFCDNVTFDNCWIGSGSENNAIYANSSLSFYGCIFVPAGSGNATGRSAVYLTNDNGAGGVANDTHRGAVFSGCRMSNEGGQGPIIVCDFPLVTDNVNITPSILFSGCNLTGFTPEPYEAGNSENGIVYLLKYPASIKFDSCSFANLGSGNGKLVAKSDGLVSDAPDSFIIDVDDATYYNAQRAVGQVSSYTIAGALRGFINNPAPYLFRDVIENANLSVIDSSTTGLKKSTFTLTSGWDDSGYPTPITFFLYLGGQGTTGVAGPNDSAYSGTSVYLVSVSFFFSGTHQAKIAYTKLHGDTYGNASAANCDIVSMHFGTGDTGSASAPRATSYDVTVTFGTNVLIGSARVDPCFEKISRFGSNPQ